MTPEQVEAALADLRELRTQSRRPWELLIAAILVGGLALNGMVLFRLGYIQARHEADRESAERERMELREELKTLQDEARTMGSAWPERIKRDILKELRDDAANNYGENHE